MKAVSYMMIFVAVLLLGCTKQTENIEEKTAEKNIQTDVQILAKLIKLSPLPEKVYWSTKTSGNSSFIGPTDWSLVAVLQYKSIQYKQLIETNQVPISGVMKISNEPFVKRLIKQKIIAQKQFDDFAISSVHPNNFIKSPLIHGYSTFSDNNYMVYLFLYTM